MSRLTSGTKQILASFIGSPYSPSPLRAYFSPKAPSHSSSITKNQTQIKFPDSPQDLEQLKNDYAVIGVSHKYARNQLDDKLSPLKDETPEIYIDITNKPPKQSPISIFGDDA